MFYCFDLLWLNGESFMNLPLSVRLEKLKKIVTPIDNRVEFVQSKYFTPKMDKEIEEFLQISKQDNCEGLIAKCPESVYECTRASTWLKLKLIILNLEIR
eukprot:UN03380